MSADPDSRRSRLDELCTSHPGLAAELRSKFERLVELGFVSLGGTDPAAAAQPALPERLGPFVIEGILGRGGMGLVYRARQPELGDRPVALKVLSPERVADPVSEARFIREGLLAARLQHPNLCPVLDVGKDGGLVYLAMPLIEGQSLALKLDARRGQDGPLPWEEVVQMGQRLAEALHVAHGKGLVHRDVKPGNILVQPSGEPVLVDFGLARDLEGDVTLTRSMDLLGTPAYMAPEQASPRGRQADARTDVYGLGTTLFECLCLRLPHEAASRAEILRRIAEQPVDLGPLRALGLPRDLVTVLGVALGLDPDTRYATARALAEDLGRVLARQPILARPPGVLRRVQGWALRNPAAAALIVSLGLGLGSSTWLYSDARAEEKRRSLEATNYRSVDFANRKLYFEAHRSARQALSMDPSDPEALGRMQEILSAPQPILRLQLRADRPLYDLSPSGRWLLAEDLQGAWLYDLDAARSAPRELPGFTRRNSSWLADGGLVGIDLEFRVVCLGADGRQRWISAVLGETDDRPTTVAAGADGELLVGTQSGRLLRLSHDEGRLLGEGQAGGSPIVRIRRFEGMDFAIVAGEAKRGERVVTVLHALHLGTLEATRIHALPAQLSRLHTNAKGWYMALNVSARILRVAHLDGRRLYIPLGGQPDAREEQIKDIYRTRSAALSEAMLAVAATDRAILIRLPEAPAGEARELPRAAGARVEGEELPRLTNQGGVNDLQFNANGSELCCSLATGDVQHWKLDPDMDQTLVRTGTTQANQLGWARNGRLAVSADNGKVMVFGKPLAPYQRLRFRYGMSNFVCQFWGENEVLTSLNGASQVLRLGAENLEVIGRELVRRGHPIRLLRGSTQAPVITCIQQRKDESPILHFFDQSEGKVVASLPGHPRGLPLVACAAPDGRTLVYCCSDKEHSALVHVFRRAADPASWRWVEKIVPPFHTRQVHLMSDGRLAIGSQAGEVRIRRLGSAKQEGTTQVLPPGRGQVTFLCSDPQETTLMVGFSTGELTAIDLRGGEPQTWTGHRTELSRIAYSADGSLLATADTNGEVGIWRPGETRPICRWRAHRTKLNSLSFAPDNERILTSAGDGFLCIWPTGPEEIRKVSRSSVPVEAAVGPR